MGYGNDGFRGGQRGPSIVPVREGEEINVKIEAVGEKGDGIAKKQGFVLFVPNTSEGDEVKVRVTKVLRKVGFAEVVGKADGPCDGGDSSSTQEDSSYEAAAPVQEEAPVEDSEDFGEEPAEAESTEDDSQEEAAETTEAEATEETSEEAPAEEVATEESEAEATEETPAEAAPAEESTEEKQEE